MILRCSIFDSSNNNNMKAKNKVVETRIATVADFKTGTTLIDAGGHQHTITDKDQDRIWNTRFGKCVFESEARFYRVAI